MRAIVLPGRPYRAVAIPVCRIVPIYPLSYRSSASLQVVELGGYLATSHTYLLDGDYVRRKTTRVVDLHSNAPNHLVKVYTYRYLVIERSSVYETISAEQARDILIKECRRRIIDVETDIPLELCPRLYPWVDEFFYINKSGIYRLNRVTTEKLLKKKTELYVRYILLDKYRAILLY